MSQPTWVSTGAALLIAARWAAQLALERLNLKYVSKHSSAVPAALRDSIDSATHARSIQYTLAKGRLRQLEDTWGTLLLVVVLFSGALPTGFRWFNDALGLSTWSMALFVFAVGLGLTLPRLPFEWYQQFHLEGRFGFNTSTPALWWTDRLKALAIGLALGYPLLVLILELAVRAGEGWWFWAWACILAFQILMALIAPAVLLPLFNRFRPLPEGRLRHRLLALAARTGFRARNIQIMDGSRRSRHSNAFFTGFDRFRRIALFDTLIEQLSEPELEAVVAHEIGHYKKKHVAKMLAWSAISLLGGFYAASWLVKQAWFYEAFGFAPGTVMPALLLIGLLSGVVTFWLAPLQNLCWRRFEFEADAFAAATLSEAGSLITALRKLNEKNLSNPTPHPLYAGFFYSHPTLLEREDALKAEILPRR